MEAARNYATVSVDAPTDEERSELDLLGGRDAGYAQVEHYLQLVTGMKTLRDRERADPRDALRRGVQVVRDRRAAARRCS